MIVIAVLIKDDKFLMVYNPKRGWEFPGGKVEAGEDCAAAAVRELREESGLVGSVVARLPDVSGACVYLLSYVRRCCSGEFAAQFLEKLPRKLSYTEYEALEILKNARKLR